jgi:heptosyltransferase I
MKIAIVKLSALGDIVHTMIILQFIRNFNKNIKVDWIVEESYKELLNYHPDINKVHVVNIKKAKKNKSLILFFKELKKVRKFGSYDLVIDFQGLVKSAIIAKLIRSKNTLGFEKTSLRESFAANFYNQTFKISYSSNIIDRNIALISYALQINITKKNILDKQPLLYSSKDYFFEFLSNNSPNIILIPGASYASKSYPISKYAEITQSIEANFIVLWGNVEEKQMSEQLLKISSKIHIPSKLSLDSLISLIHNADLVIGSDTGPTHLAWALNIPSITLFGPTPGYRNTYQTNINKLVESNSKVNPNKINKNDLSIKNIQVNDVVKIALNLLGKKKKI